VSDETPNALSPDAARDLAAVLDAIVPPRPDGLPGAGGLGLVAFIEARMAEHPDLRPAVLHGLAALDALARERSGGAFADVPAGERAALLNELASREPAFLPGLIFQTYVGYYQDPRVLEALGVEGRPPFPQGYEVEPFDPGLLEPVRGRDPLWRRP
jgi:hypothetical protein